MAEETAYQQQGGMPERANAETHDSAYDAALSPAYDAVPSPAYDAAPEPAYVAVPAVEAGEQVLPASVNLGATQNMDHVPLDSLMLDAQSFESPEDMQGGQAQAEFAGQFDQPRVEPLDQVQDASLAQSLPSSVAMNVDPVQVKTITVRTGRLVLDVEIPEAQFRYTTPRLAAFTNGQYPDLPHHACVNDEGMTFGYVMEKTSVAHLLEHLIISEQVRSQATGNTTFVGTTEWTSEQAGKARVEVGFKDDLVALRAFNKATRFLNMAVLTCLV